MAHASSPLHTGRSSSYTPPRNFDDDSSTFNLTNVVAGSLLVGGVAFLAEGIGAAIAVTIGGLALGAVLSAIFDEKSYKGNPRDRSRDWSWPVMPFYSPAPSRSYSNYGSRPSASVFSSGPSVSSATSFLGFGDNARPGSRSSAPSAAPSFLRSFTSSGNVQVGSRGGSAVRPSVLTDSGNVAVGSRS